MGVARHSNKPQTGRGKPSSFTVMVEARGSNPKKHQIPPFPLFSMAAVPAEGQVDPLTAEGTRTKGSLGPRRMREGGEGRGEGERRR